VSQTKYVVIETNYVSAAINGESVESENRKDYKFTLKYIDGDLIAVAWNQGNGYAVLYADISFHDRNREDNRTSYSAINENTGEKTIINIRNDSSPLKIVISDMAVVDGENVLESIIFYKEKQPEKKSVSHKKTKPAPHSGEPLEPIQ